MTADEILAANQRNTAWASDRLSGEALREQAKMTALQNQANQKDKRTEVMERFGVDIGTGVDDTIGMAINQLRVVATRGLRQVVITAVHGLIAELMPLPSDDAPVNLVMGDPIAELTKRVAALENVVSRTSSVGLSESMARLRADLQARFEDLANQFKISSHNQGAAEGRVRKLEELSVTTRAALARADKAIGALEEKFAPDDLVDTIRRELQSMDKVLFGGEGPNIVQRIEKMERREMAIRVEAQWVDKAPEPSQT